MCTLRTILELSKEGASRKKMAIQGLTLSFLPASFTYWLSFNAKIKGNLMILILWTLWNYWCKFIAWLIMSFVAWIRVTLDSNSKWSGVLSLDSVFCKFLSNSILTIPLSLFLGVFFTVSSSASSRPFCFTCAHLCNKFSNLYEKYFVLFGIGCFPNISHLWITMLFIIIC